jgi:hypothetical protein
MATSKFTQIKLSFNSYTNCRNIAHGVLFLLNYLFRDSLLAGQGIRSLNYQNSFSRRPGFHQFYNRLVVLFRGWNVSQMHEYLCGRYRFSRH